MNSREMVSMKKASGSVSENLQLKNLRCWENPFSGWDSGGPLPVRAGNTELDGTHSQLSLWQVPFSVLQIISVKHVAYTKAKEEDKTRSAGFW